MVSLHELPLCHDLMIIYHIAVENYTTYKTNYEAELQAAFVTRQDEDVHKGINNWTTLKIRNTTSELLELPLKNNSSATCRYDKSMHVSVSRKESKNQLLSTKKSKRNTRS